MSGANVVREQLFEPEVLGQLVQRLPSFVDHLNAEDGEVADGHQSEMVLQREIGKRLKTWLPSPTLVRQNEMLVKENDQSYIPDLIIDKIGGGCWAVFELKTLLRTDKLPISYILEDLEKLCKYEAKHPEALCMFILIASEEKLTNTRRQKSWEDLPISIDGDAFIPSKMRHQQINDSHVAIPWLFNDELTTCVYIWLVRHKNRAGASRTGSYCFHARMSQNV